MQSPLIVIVQIAHEDVLVFFFRQQRVTADNLMTRRRLMSACEIGLTTLIGSYASTFFVDTAVRYFVLWYILKKIGISKQLRRDD